jgi:hypothetical protein
MIMEPIVRSIVASALCERPNDVENRGGGYTGEDYDDAPKRKVKDLG